MSLYTRLKPVERFVIVGSLSDQFTSRLAIGQYKVTWPAIFTEKLLVVGLTTGTPPSVHVFCGVADLNPRCWNLRLDFKSTRSVEILSINTDINVNFYLYGSINMTRVLLKLLIESCFFCYSELFTVFFCNCKHTTQTEAGWSALTTDLFLCWYNKSMILARQIIEKIGNGDIYFNARLKLQHCRPPSPWALLMWSRLICLFWRKASK